MRGLEQGKQPYVSDYPVPRPPPRSRQPLLSFDHEARCTPFLGYSYGAFPTEKRLMEIFYMLTPEELQAVDAWEGRPLSWSAPLEKSIGGIVRGLGDFSNLNWIEQTPPGCSPLLHIFPFPLGHLSSLQLPLKADICMETAVSCSPVFLLMVDSPLSLSQASMSVLFPMLPDLPPFQLPCSPLSWMGHLNSVSHSEAYLADKWPSARLANFSCSADHGCGPLGSLH